MELEVRFMGNKYIEFTFLSGNATLSTGFINKKEAQAFIKQITDLIDDVNELAEVK